MTALVVAVSPETASESVVDLAPRNFSRTAEPMETPATVLAVFATYYAACGEDEPFLVVDAGDVSYRGACVNEDAVDACLVAARCSIIDAEAVGPPDACGDAIAGRVHRV